MAVEKNPYIIDDFITDNFADAKEGIIIFGTGVWGEWFQHIFEACNIPVEMFVDNDQARWNTQLNGIWIYAPEKLKSGKGCIVVAVKNSAMEICKQLRDLGNTKIRWVTLDEMQDKVLGEYIETGQTF